MNKLLLMMGVAMMFLAGVALCADAEGPYVRAAQKNTPVYGAEVRPMYEQPAFIVGPDAPLMILQSRRMAYQVRDPGGRVGWIEKRLAVPTKPAKRFSFDTTAVSGYLDNPGYTAIFDDDNRLKNDSTVVFERSFKAALMEPVDQDKAELRVKEREPVRK